MIGQDAEPLLSFASTVQIIWGCWCSCIPRRESSLWHQYGGGICTSRKEHSPFWKLTKLSQECAAFSQCARHRWAKSGSACTFFVWCWRCASHRRRLPPPGLESPQDYTKVSSFNIIQFLFIHFKNGHSVKIDGKSRLHHCCVAHMDFVNFSCFVVEYSRFMFQDHINNTQPFIWPRSSRSQSAR